MTEVGSNCQDTQNTHTRQRLVLLCKPNISSLAHVPSAHIGVCVGEPLDVFGSKFVFANRETAHLLFKILPSPLTQVMTMNGKYLPFLEQKTDINTVFRGWVWFQEAALQPLAQNQVSNVGSRSGWCTSVPLAGAQTRLDLGAVCHPTWLNVSSQSTDLLKHIWRCMVKLWRVSFLNSTPRMHCHHHAEPGLALFRVPGTVRSHLCEIPSISCFTAGCYFDACQEHSKAWNKLCFQMHVSVQAVSDWCIQRTVRVVVKCVSNFCWGVVCVGLWDVPLLFLSSSLNLYGYGARSLPCKVQPCWMLGIVHSPGILTGWQFRATLQASCGCVHVYARIRALILFERQGAVRVVITYCMQVWEWQQGWLNSK